MSKIYTTMQGDMWDSIAHTQLGSVTYMDKLMSLNPEYINYYVFPAGIRLSLPEINPGKPSTMPPWKQVSG